MNCEDWTGEEINVNDEHRDPEENVQTSGDTANHTNHTVSRNIYESKQMNVCP